MEHSIVWDCPNCSQRNTTLSDQAIPDCWQCRREYGWKDAAFIAAVSHEETLDDDGNFSADAWIPDFDDFTEERELDAIEERESRKWCKACNGRGMEDDSQPCLECDGTGIDILYW